MDRLIKALKLHKSHSDADISLTNFGKPEDMSSKKKRGRKRKYPRPGDDNQDGSYSSDDDE
jgi:hypothetical protein